MNLHPKLYLALAALGIVVVTAAYYEWREPLPFDEKNPVSMKAPNIRAHAKRGNPDAQFALGSLYARGDKWQGIPEDTLTHKKPKNTTWKPLKRDSRLRFSAMASSS